MSTFTLRHREHGKTSPTFIAAAARSLLQRTQGTIGIVTAYPEAVKKLLEPRELRRITFISPAEDA